MPTKKPDIAASALIIVDMQNDFVSHGGYFDRLAKAHPEIGFDMEFLVSIVPDLRKLSTAFRAAGRPVVYIRHALAPDYSDACFPYWKLPLDPVQNRFVVEGTWGARIVDELTPEKNDSVVVKKGYDGFYNTPLESILSALGINTCIVTGVSTRVCVSTTIRSGVERKFNMTVVRDCTAAPHRSAHESEMVTLSWAYAEIKTAHEAINMLGQ